MHDGLSCHVVMADASLDLHLRRMCLIDLFACYLFIWHLLPISRTRVAF